MCCELIDWVCERNIPGDFTMDCYFTSAEVLNHVHAKTDRFGRPRGYVGDLKTNRNLEWKGRIVKASDLAASIPPEDRKELRQETDGSGISRRRCGFPTSNTRCGS